MDDTYNAGQAAEIITSYDQMICSITFHFHSPPLCVCVCVIWLWSVNILVSLPTLHLILQIFVSPRILQEIVHKSVWPDLTPSPESNSKVTIQRFTYKAMKGLAGAWDRKWGRKKEAKKGHQGEELGVEEVLRAYM